MCRAHPRVGGDGSTTRWRTLLTWGSPPRGRGRLAGSAALLRGRGLTPAWAGTAPCAHAATRSAWAHPRVGGDGLGFGHAWVSGSGSPPRGRGRRQSSRTKTHKGGLTPAWAGTARSRERGCVPSWAHPRVGGDGIDADGSTEPKLGSPPRGRGRPVIRGLLIQGVGLTPAWAGTAISSAPDRACSRAHPRVGGDGSASFGAPAAREGSPPRGRGRLRVVVLLAGRPGLTPAWAGTATWRSSATARTRAHPRVGGDGGLRPWPTCRGVGSPPRGRGRLEVALTVEVLGGLTPAWAGTARTGCRARST